MSINTPERVDQAATRGPRRRDTIQHRAHAQEHAPDGTAVQFFDGPHCNMNLLFLSLNMNLHCFELAFQVRYLCFGYRMGRLRSRICFAQVVQLQELLSKLLDEQVQVGKLEILAAYHCIEGFYIPPEFFYPAVF